MIKGSQPYRPTGGHNSGFHNSGFQPSPQERQQAHQQALIKRDDNNANRNDTRPYTVLVSGGRDFNDFDLVTRTMDALDPQPELIIHGAARGADILAGQWAKLRGIPVQEFECNWRPNGVFDKAAGFKRNNTMLVQGRPHLVVAFPGGSGTADMVRIATRAGVAVTQVKWPHGTPAPTK